MPATQSDGSRRRLHPISPLFDFIVGLRNFALPLLLGLFFRGDRSQLVFLVPLVLFTIPNIVGWWGFTYRIEHDTLVIEKGVFGRSVRTVPLDRIQQIDATSRLRDRIFGVTALRIDTAGGSSGAEVALKVVSTSEAARLRGVLLGRGAGPGVPAASSAEHAPPQDDVLVRVGTGHLALAGVTGSELAVMLSIVLWLSQWVRDLPDSIVEDAATRLAAPDTIAEFAATTAALVSLWFGLAAVASIVKNAGYTIVREGDSLRVRRGLFERREVSMQLRRLQAVRVQRAFLRRMLGFSAVRLHSGGSVNAGSKRVDVPLLPDAAVPGLLSSLLADLPSYDLVAAPRAARRRAILRRVVPVALLALPPCIVVPELAPVAAAVVAAAAVAGELAFRGLGHALAGPVVVARSGGIFRESVFVPMAKTQSTRLRTTPLQRRAGLGTLFIDVAGRGGTPAVRDAALADLEQLRRLVLVEPARADELAVRERPAAEAVEAAR